MKILPETAAAPEEHTANRLLEIAGLIVTPFATLTSLLFYIGWVRTNAAFTYFGVDPNLLYFAPQDYLARSVALAFQPSLVLLLGTAALFGLHRLLARAIATRPRLRGLIVGELLMLATVLAAPSVVALAGPASGMNPLAVACCLVAAAALAEIAATLWSAPGRAYRRVLVACLVIVGVFRAVSCYALQNGDEISAALLPTQLAAVVVFSADDLALHGPGVTESPVATAGPYHYRYAGLRLLIFRGGRWFLIPAGWREDRSYQIVLLTDSNRLRVELQPAPHRLV